MLTIILIVSAVIAAWLIAAVGLALFIGRAVRIADRHERKRIKSLARA